MLHHWGSIEIDNIGVLLKKIDDYKLLNVKRLTLSMPMSKDVGGKFTPSWVSSCESRWLVSMLELLLVNFVNFYDFSPRKMMTKLTKKIESSLETSEIYGFFMIIFGHFLSKALWTFQNSLFFKKIVKAFSKILKLQFN